MDPHGLDSKQDLSCSSSIIGDTQMPICDESLKRDAESMGLEENRDCKSKKKRRSSLSSKRRSITGQIVSNLNFDPSSLPSEPLSQNQMTTPAVENEVWTTEKSRLLPNPTNIKMAKTTEQMEKQIKTLDNEYTQWKQLLKSFEEKEKESNLLVLNPSLPIADIPQEIKDFAAVEFMTSTPLDLSAMKTELDQFLQHYQFYREACCQDLKLIKETVTTVQKTNRMFSSSLSQVLAEDVGNNKEETEADNLLTDRSFPHYNVLDVKQVMLSYASCS